MMEIAAVVSGALTGFIVGMTGVGGGSLMTPILILLLGVAPGTAVGTDLLFATVTKLVAVKVHGAHGTIDWQIVKRLAWGSIPAACVVLLLMHRLALHKGAGDVIMPALGIALVLTAIAMLLKRRLHELGRRWRTTTPTTFKRLQPGLTVTAGAILGTLVTLTSIGAGALGTVLLAYLYPLRLTPARLVGTDLAHAVPLALIAGLGYLWLGNIDFKLLGWLLLGSLPAVWLGSHLSARAPDRLVRNTIAVILLLIGAKILI
jgi:uncharacterized membrane protein YfcA